MKNFITRTLTSILFVAVLVGCILYGRHSFGGLFVLITALSVAEFCRIVNAREGVQVNAVITTISGALLFMAFYLYASGSCDAAIFFPYLLSLLYLLVSELYLKQENPLSNWAYALMAQLYVALPFALLNVLYFQTDPAHPTFVVEHWNVPLAVFCFLWASDAGAYCVGSVLGRYFPARLFPRISPKKSWVGSIGGGLLAMAVATWWRVSSSVRWASRIADMCCRGMAACLTASTAACWPYRPRWCICISCRCMAAERSNNVN